MIGVINVVSNCPIYCPVMLVALYIHLGKEGGRELEEDSSCFIALLAFKWLIHDCKFSVSSVLTRLASLCNMVCVIFMSSWNDLPSCLAFD